MVPQGANPGPSTEPPSPEEIVLRLTAADWGGLGSELRWHGLVEDIDRPGPVVSTLLVRFRPESEARAAWAHALALTRDVLGAPHTRVLSLVDVEHTLFGEALWDVVASFEHRSRRDLVLVLLELAQHPQHAPAADLLRRSVERAEWLVGE